MVQGVSFLVSGFVSGGLTYQVLTGAHPALIAVSVGVLVTCALLDLHSIWGGRL